MNGIKIMFITLGIFISIPSLIQMILTIKDIARGSEEYIVFLYLFCITFVCGVIEIIAGVLI